MSMTFRAVSRAAFRAVSRALRAVSRAAFRAVSSCR